MALPARNTLAVIGAGPVGLEAALAALDAGFDVHVFERGDVGAHLSAWGHVRLFTPWRMNVGTTSRERLERSGWKWSDPEACPTGAELVAQVLEPLALLPELKDRVHTHAQVVHVSRRGTLKGDLVANPERREFPFRLLVRDTGGRENFIHAFNVIDASGVYGTPNWAGDGGIPARQELYLGPQLSYHLDDVKGLRRERYAGKRTMVIGAGHSAATVVRDLAELATEAPGTRVLWATRGDAATLFLERADDSLPERATLDRGARALVAGADPAVTHVGGAVIEGFEFNSATHRYRVALRIGEQTRNEEVDQVIVNTGYGPDNSIYRELQIHECYGSRGPMKLSAAILGASGAAGGDCTKMPAFGIDALANPEPDYFIVGNKSYARYSSFLLETGYRQVADVVASLAANPTSLASAAVGTAAVSSPTG
ncbi:MAG: FAD-dependent oxidoreductase [Candidatus Eisenbacteria bacterium]|uniref:FAD-dependent oxidoreductase n=1 Tax=Eiseniibacteriota bacterium TaxID=2212470 RepID=A0A849SRS9_UNCEI|nr:FAD-dependent oxidoreductase [Candidatus Eisenbacteria bacterium]